MTTTIMICNENSNNNNNIIENNQVKKGLLKITIMIMIKHSRILIWNSRQKDINMNYRVINSLLYINISYLNHLVHTSIIFIFMKKN